MVENVRFVHASNADADARAMALDPRVFVPSL